MDSALRTEPGTSQSQTVSASLRHSLVRCPGSRLLTNHRTPASALPWTHLLPESQAVGLWKLPGTTPALPTTRPASKGHPNVSNSQRVPCCFQPTQPRVLADSQGSTWRALPRFPDPTRGRAELSCLCPPCLYWGTPGSEACSVTALSHRAGASSLSLLGPQRPAQGSPRQLVKQMT